MPRKPKKQRSCDGKRAFDARDDAENHITFVRRRLGANPQYLHTYKCEHCKKFHVGHMIRPNARRRR